MRTDRFFDWVLEIVLLGLFCLAVTGADYVIEGQVTTTIYTMWCVAGVWACMGLLRITWRAISAINGPAKR